MYLPSGETVIPQLTSLSGERTGVVFPDSKVEEFYFFLGFRCTIEEVNTITNKEPVIPLIESRLIHYAHLRAAIQRPLPYASHFELRVIEEAMIGGFDAINAPILCYPDRRAPRTGTFHKSNRPLSRSDAKYIHCPSRDQFGAKLSAPGSVGTRRGPPPATSTT
jgi:hypothetical protein